MTSPIEVEEFLEHFGKKGMKWGVRQQNRLNSAKRVASGKAMPGDKADVLGRQSMVSIARSGGNIQKMAAKDAMKLEAQKARIKSGKAHTTDYLNKYGAFNLG